MSDYMDSLYSGLNDESLTAITAGIGFNDGANKGFWRKQPRKKWGKGKGQWIEMGARLRALFNINGKLQSVTGRSAGSDGTPNGVRFRPDPGQAGVDSNLLYGVDTAHLEEIQATLPDNYVESKGLKANREQTGTGSVVSTANIPDINDMETAPVTPDDIRMIEEGVNSKEGQEAENFKNTDEGKQVASLDDVEESDVLRGKDVNELVEPVANITTPADYDLELDPISPLVQAKLVMVPDAGNQASGYYDYADVDEPEKTLPNTIFGIENKGGGNWEFYNYKTGEIFPVKANSLEEVEKEMSDYRLQRGNFDPEVLQAKSDEETANARGFTETMRGSLQGMKGRNIKGGFAKAYPNGRTATIVQDDDGSWHLEKHDEFNGGIQETKRFEDNFFGSGLDAALAEGDAYLNEDIALPMTRKEFGEYVNNRYNDAERTKPAFLDEDAIDEAFESYSDIYKESKSDNGWVSKDMDADARSQAFSEMDDMAVSDEKNPLGDVDQLIKDAMGGKDANLDQWLEAKDKGGDKGGDGTPGDADGDGTSDEDDPDFEEDLEDTELELTSADQDPELLRDIISKERDEAENIRLNDVIMGPDGMPVRVRSFNWDESDSDEESPGLTITATDANGEEVEFYKNRYDSVFYPEFAPEGAAPKATPAAKKAEPVAATPATPTRVAPDNALEVDAGRVQIGDKLYSPDGSTLLGEVTQVRKKGGKTEARLSLDGKDEGFQELGPVNLVDRDTSVNAQKQAEKDAKKAEAARVKAEKKAAEEKAAADKAAAINDPRTDEGIENLKSILEGADNPERLQAALDVLNDPSLSNDEKAEKLVEALTTNLGALKGSDEQRMNARQAEGKALKLLEKAGIPGASLEERKAANAKRSSRAAIQSITYKFPESLTLASEVDEMKKRIDAGEDVPVEETEALRDKIAAHQDRFWMKGDSNDKPKPGESERVDEEIRKAQREGTAPIPFVRKDGTEIRPDDNTAAPVSPTASPAGVTPVTPKAPKPITKQPKGKPLGTPDDDGKPIDGASKTPEEVAAMRERKLQNAVDENGDPVYETDLNGDLVLDKKGRPKRVQDTDAILAALRADYPNAKLDAQGNIVVHREDYVGADGKQKRLEMLVHKNTGGKIGISMKFTDLESGESEMLIHHDERDSYGLGLHGKTNGIQALLDIVQGKKPGTDRRTATRGYDTTGRTDLRERAEYFVKQNRMLTHEQVWAKYLDGYTEEINTSAGGRGVNKGKAYMTLRRKGVPSAAEALREGDRYTFFQRVRAAAGHTPVTPEGRAALRKSVRDYLAKEMPELTPRERTVLAQYVDRSMQGKLVDPKGRENPFGSFDGTPVKPGDYVEYTNNVGEVSRGRIETLQEPQLNATGTEYNDNVVVRFADGSVEQLTSQNMRISKDQKAPVGIYKKNKQGAELRRLRKEQLAATAARTTGLLRFLDDVRAERAETEEAGNKTGGKIEDLGTGDTLFSKDGEPLGPIIDKIPIVGKSGNPGFAVIYENADGEEVQVRLPLGEFRGPKA